MHLPLSNEPRNHYTARSMKSVQCSGAQIQSAERNDVAMQKEARTDKSI
jgi:hypothetical protein